MLVFFRVEMIFGVAASTSLLKDFGGTSTHRRTVRHGRFNVDLHMRIRDVQMATTTFSGSGYIHSLGQELGSFTDACYYELVHVIFDWLIRTTGHRSVDQGTVLMSFPTDQGLYAHLSQTSLYRCLRYMLCKSSFLLIIEYFELIRFFCSASDFKTFLDLEGVYLEPQMTKDHLRLFVYLGATLTVYAGNPFSISHCDDKQIPKPMFDGSM